MGRGTGDEAEVTPVPTDRELYRYRGPRFEFEFYGSALERGGRTVLSIELGYVRWAGERAGQPVTDEDRALMADALRAYYRGRGIPYELSHLSGEIEDETGRLRPGFASALPRASHSDGWSLEDLWQSPEFPDPEVYPSTIAYADPEGSAELTRSIKIVDEVRHERFHDVPVKVRRKVLHPATLHWTGDRTGEPMTDIDRARITERIRSVYDEWGYAYEVEESSPGQWR